MYTEFKHLANTLLSWLLSWLLLAAFFFSFGLREVAVGGWSILVPVPSTTHSLAALAFETMKKSLVPEEVTLIVTNPLTGFLAEAEVALFLGLLLSFPFLAGRAGAYLAPALFVRERKKVSVAVFVSVVLFAAGCLFAYLFVIPAMFDVLYPYARALGAATFLEVGEFISLTFGFMAVVGIAFLLPVFMVTLSRLRIVPARIWTDKWGYALLVFLTLSAIITPDGSGVGMAFLTLPLVTLYGVGIAASRKL